MRPRAWLATAAVLVMAAGCAVAPAPTDAPKTQPALMTEQRMVEELLADYNRLAMLPPTEQAHEYDSALATFERNHGAAERLRLALALCLPQAPWRDDRRVLQLLEPLTDTAPQSHAPLVALAGLLHHLVSERLRLLSEEQARAGETQQKLQHLLAERQRQLREEQHKVEELQGKFDALRNIDRELRRRPSGK